MPRQFSFSCALLLAAIFILIAELPGYAQGRDELALLNQQVTQLRDAGKYVDAIPIAHKALALVEQRFGGNHPAVVGALNGLAWLYLQEGRPREAEPLYKRALEIEETRNPEHTAVATQLAHLASVYNAQGRYREAEPLFQRALTIREKAAGPDDAFVGSMLNSLGYVAANSGRHAEAETLYQRSLTIAEKAHGQESAEFALRLNNLGGLYQAMGRYADAEAQHRRALGIREKVLGPDHRDVAVTLNNVAVATDALGRYGEAEQLYKRALAVRERSHGPEHPGVAVALNNLAGFYSMLGRNAEAEPLMKRALAIREKAYGPNHPEVAHSLGTLANLYKAQGRRHDAEALYKRALAVAEAALGPGSLPEADSLNNLGLLYLQQRRFAEAEPLFRRSLEITERLLGVDHAKVGQLSNNLGGLYREMGRYADAEPLYRRALAIAEKSLGPEHHAVAIPLNNLARLYEFQGQYAKAEAQHQRALTIKEKALGPQHASLGLTLNNIAYLHFLQQDWERALAYFNRSTDIVVAGARLAGPGAALRTREDPGSGSFRFVGAIKAAYRLALKEPGRRNALIDAAFRSAQLSEASQTAASLAQMAARQARRDSALARLVRELQDLDVEWGTRDKQLIAAVSSPADRRDAAGEGALRGKLAAIQARSGEIKARLARDFPDYTSLSSPEPLDINEVQQMLGANEALVLLLDTPEWKPTPEETFVWVVTKGDARWLQVNAGSRFLAGRVAALRCGLDETAWEGEGSERCARLLQKTHSATDRASGLPFDLARAHNLYEGLFGSVEQLIKSKHLLIVAAGPLSGLPFHVLVTEKPEVSVPDTAQGYANAAWLGKRNPISVLPSVSSLRALRHFAKASKATQPFIGFGNPLLTGPNGTDRRAWERQSCKAQAAPIQTASRRVRSTTPKFFRSGLANVQEVRAQYSLPETADELCAVAQSFGAAEDFVYLGEKATEGKIKALSASGALERARIVHFATHGLLAGETEMLAAAKAEPALILTPPQMATEEDDGLLTASEIAQLKLDADWVVLSACNTAAGESDNPGAEALSGLARAFFYAGARALLVSHWAVNSEATVSLITKAFDELKADPRIGRADALRRSMLALMQKGGGYAHPANWAPFVVVGEGAVR